MLRAAVRVKERGDTIVEVMFAIAVFAAVAAGALAIMNQGAAITQRSLEITQVRQAMNDQAELLRFVQQEYFSSGGKAQKLLWEMGIRGAVRDEATPFGELAGSGGCLATADIQNRGGHPFVLRSTGGSVTMISGSNIKLGAQPPDRAYAGLSGGTSYGLWIEAVRPSSKSSIIDFHIRSCWDAPGASVPVTLGTIVRLYDKEI